MAGWRDIAQICGSAAGALVGLLFVAISIRINVLTASKEFSSRAAQILILFATVLVLSILLAIPGQSLRIFGVETLCIVVLFASGTALLERRAKRDAHPLAASHLLDVVAPRTSIFLILCVSGGLLVSGVHGGLYVLVAGMLLALVGGLTSSWLFLTNVSE